MRRAEEDTVKVATSRRRAGTLQARKDTAPKQVQDCAKQIHREWGEPVRAGAKPNWYQKLFHH